MEDSALKGAHMSGFWGKAGSNMELEEESAILKVWKKRPLELSI